MHITITTNNVYILRLVQTTVSYESLNKNQTRNEKILPETHKESYPWVAYMSAIPTRIVYKIFMKKHIIFGAGGKPSGGRKLLLELPDVVPGRVEGALFEASCLEKCKIFSSRSASYILVLCWGFWKHHNFYSVLKKGK